MMPDANDPSRPRPKPPVQRSSPIPRTVLASAVIE
jgi:hypothetical protein